MSFARCKSQTDRQPVRVHHCMNFAVNPPRERPIDCPLFLAMQAARLNAGPKRCH